MVMGFLTAAQQHYYFVYHANRAGIHAPLLAALYGAHQAPLLADEEEGLGMAPANRLTLDQLNTFPAQVQMAATTVRSITNRLIAQGWEAPDIWQEDGGCYAERFLLAIADGYAPSANDTESAQLEAVAGEVLQSLYQSEVSAIYNTCGLPENLSFVEAALLQFVAEVPEHYLGLSYQRNALLEALRLWRKLDSLPEAIAALQVDSDVALDTDPALDRTLMDVLSKLSHNYVGYPHQREALLRLVQGWRQLPSREAAIASLAQSASAVVPPSVVDAPLMAFVQRLPRLYQGKGEQRNWLTEGYRLWHDLDSRTVAIRHLGIDPKTLVEASPAALEQAARQLDRALLQFVREIPLVYDGHPPQREALVKLVQLWHRCDTLTEAREHLLETLQRMERAALSSEDVPPPPCPQAAPSAPLQWSLETLQLDAPMAPHGSFTWADATQGGLWLPENQMTLEAMVELAKLLEEVRDRLQRKLHIALWYYPSDVPLPLYDPGSDRHAIGDAIKFHCEGLLASQIYWTLDPWWPGSLGRCRDLPHLVHLDLAADRSRWIV